MHIFFFRRKIFYFHFCNNFVRRCHFSFQVFWTDEISDAVLRKEIEASISIEGCTDLEWLLETESSDGRVSASKVKEKKPNRKVGITRLFFYYQIGIEKKILTLSLFLHNLLKLPSFSSGTFSYRKLAAIGAIFPLQAAAWNKSVELHSYQHIEYEAMKTSNITKLLFILQESLNWCNLLRRFTESKVFFILNYFNWIICNSTLRKL